MDIDTTKRKELRFRETTTHTNVVVVVGRRVVVADDDDDDVSSSPAQVRVSLSLSIFALNGESSSPNCLNHVSRACILMITFTNSFV